MMYGVGGVYSGGYGPYTSGWSGRTGGSSLGASDLESIERDEQSAQLLSALGGSTFSPAGASTFTLGMLGMFLDVMDTNRQSSGISIHWPHEQAHGSGDGSSGSSGVNGGTGLASGGGDQSASGQIYG